MERENPRKDEAYRDKNGKYLNRNDVVEHGGEYFTFVTIVEPFMYAIVLDQSGAERELIPAELDKQEYVV